MYGSFYSFMRFKLDLYFVPFRCCLLIMEHFKNSKLFEKNKQRSRLTSARGTRRQRILEYGVLLQKEAVSEHKTKEAQNTDFWVVGKQIYRDKGNVQQTVLICFQDRIEQSLVDLAFSLPFGLNWMD